MPAEWMAQPAAALQCPARSQARSALPAHLHPPRARALLSAASMSLSRLALLAHSAMVPGPLPMRAE
jgi:hypothetical protein